MLGLIEECSLDLKGLERVEDRGSAREQAQELRGGSFEATKDQERRKICLTPRS